MSKVGRSMRTGLLAVMLVSSSVLHARGLPVRPQGVSVAVEQSINKALAFLARTQNRSGFWRSGTARGSYPCTMTALSGLALMAGGNTMNQGKYAVNVRRAVDYVVECGNRNGLIARIEEEAAPMYSHGFGMLFLAQAYGMETDPRKQQEIHRVLERGIRLTAQSQSRDGGWLYTPDANSDEGSVTVTQIQALRACRNAGIKVPRGVINRACEYINKCANKDGGISYSLRNKGSSRPAITAAAVSTLYNVGEYDNPVALRALGYLKKRLKGATSGRVFGGHQFYSMLYMSQAMYLSSEENWNFYFPMCSKTLLSTQAKNGSWMGDGMGEVYGTAIGLMVLQLPYKYLPILQR